MLIITSFFNTNLILGFDRIMGEIFVIIRDVYGQDLDNEKIQEALTFKKNQRLAEIGDSILDVVILEMEYRSPDSSPTSMDNLRKVKVKREMNQQILRKDSQLTKYLLEHDYSQNPQGKIGLIRSDRYMEAIIGAIYLTCGLDDSQKFIEKIYKISHVE